MDLLAGAILWAFAASGFWQTGHTQGYLFYDLWTCEAARGAVEEDMRGRGYEGIRTVCVEVKGRG